MLQASSKIGRYNLTVKIHSSEHCINVPYSIEVDFDKIFTERKIHGSIDKNSILVTSENNEFIHFNLSDSFMYCNLGKINFLIRDTNVTQYKIHFDSMENGPYYQSDYIGLVGNGDCIRFNSGNPLPLYNGMNGAGNIADIDLDGKNELISPQCYTHVKGREWHVINAYRNTGTQNKPVWGDAVPLRCIKDGKLIMMKGASSVYITDFDNDGRPDILTCGYGAYEKMHDVYIHINTGRLDGSCFPLFEYKGKIRLLDAGYISSICYVDLMNTGYKGLLISRTYKTITIERDDELWFDATEEEKAAAKWPRWGFTCGIEYYEHDHFDENGIPIMKDPVQIAVYSGIAIAEHAHLNFDVIKNNKTGLHDIIYGHSNSDFSDYSRKCRTHLVYLLNTGKRFENGSLMFRKVKEYPHINDRSTLGIKICNSREYNGILRSSGQLGGRIVYYPFAGYDADGYPDYGNMEYLLQKNPYVNSFCGFAHGAVCDFDGDGDVDIVTGCENAFSMVIENTGTQEKPVFNDAERFTYKNSVLELMNGPFDDPGSFGEAPLGQTSAFYMDFNFDGIPDLVVKVGLRIYLYINKGTAKQPVLSPPAELLTDGGNRFGAHRNHPAIGDFTGNGCPDIICDSKDMSRLYLYRGYKGTDNKLKFCDGEALKYENGEYVSPIKWHRYTKNWSFGDWNRTGVNSLFLSTCTLIMMLENVGTSENPVFRQPVLFKDGNEQDFNIGHHICMPIPVDWDKTGRTDILISGESGMFYLFRRSYFEGTQKKIDYTLDY